MVGTYVLNGKRRRQRACRHCGTPIRTYEVPVPPGHDVQVVPQTEIAPAVEPIDPSLPPLPGLMPSVANQPPATEAPPPKKHRKRKATT